ncbi:MAG: hypothetical protein JRJ62_13945 [Deltaproteobacteria bacterium]|nr:hypothetical protein [Deltaproteobacteria bacterium]
MKDKIEIQKSNYEWLLNSINNADAKAGFLITVVLALIGFTITQMDRELYYSNNSECLEIYLILMIIAVLVFSVISLSFAVAAVWPKFTEGSKSIFYYNAIHSLDKEDYTEWVSKTDDNALFEDISGQVWYLSRIIKNKYKYIRIGMLFFGLSLIILILTYLIGA